MERTLVVLKPDAVQRRLAGEILRRFEQRGLTLVGLKMLQLSDARARRMYSVHKGKDFYEPLVKFVTSGPVIAGVLQGRDAVATVRAMLGETNAPRAAAGTIRGDFGLSRRHNLIHGSDSPESADREIPIFFRAEELVDYTHSDAGWVYEQ